MDDATVNKFMQTKLLEAIPYDGSGIEVGFFLANCSSKKAARLLFISTPHIEDQWSRG